jgi:hypothetical protein
MRLGNLRLLTVTMSQVYRYSPASEWSLVSSCHLQRFDPCMDNPRSRRSSAVTGQPFPGPIVKRMKRLEGPTTHLSAVSHVHSCT